MNNPKLRFKLNKALDIKMAQYFFKNQQRAGFNFWRQGALSLHEDLKLMDHAKNKSQFLKKYIDKIYSSNNKAIIRRKSEIEYIYKLKEKKIFQKINKVFKNFKWPVGKYICYLSIFSFNPRFLNEKTFQTFMYDTAEGILFIIIHEYLHFMFYKYCLKKYGPKFKNMNLEEGGFWQMAETFNSLIQRGEDFKEIYGNINCNYPEIQAIIKNKNIKWQQDVDGWILKYYSLFIK